MVMFNSYVSFSEGTPKWMVYNTEKSPFQIDDLGGTPISGNLHLVGVLQIVKRFPKNRLLKTCVTMRLILAAQLV